MAAQPLRYHYRDITVTVASLRAVLLHRAAILLNLLQPAHLGGSFPRRDPSEPTSAETRVALRSL